MLYMYYVVSFSIVISCLEFSFRETQAQNTLNIKYSYYLILQKLIKNAVEIGRNNFCGQIGRCCPQGYSFYFSFYWAGSDTNNTHTAWKQPDVVYLSASLGKGLVLLLSLCHGSHCFLLAAVVMKKVQRRMDRKRDNFFMYSPLSSDYSS